VSAEVAAKPPAESPGPLTLLGTYAGIGRAYLRWARFLLMLGVVVFVPVGLVHSLAVEADIGSLDFGGVVVLLGLAAALLVLIVTGLLGEVFYTGAVAASLTHVHDGDPPTLREIARAIDYGRLIAVDLIYGAAVAIGTLLLVVPGILAFVWLALAAPVIEIERRGVRDSLRRSLQLVRGRFWLVLAVLFPIEVVGEAVTAAATGLADDLVGDRTLISHWLADVLSNLAFTPFYAVAAVILTVGLIHEKDGSGPALRVAPRQP
jgi:hypothetical protein